MKIDRRGKNIITLKNRTEWNSTANKNTSKETKQNNFQGLKVNTVRLNGTKHRLKINRRKQSIKAFTNRSEWN